MSHQQTTNQEQFAKVSGGDGLVVSTDDQPLYKALREGGADESLAYTATQRVRDMASVNAVTFLSAKIEAQGAELRSQIAAQGSRIQAQGSRIEALGSRIEAQGSRIEAQGNELRARIDAQGTELRAQIAAQRMVLTAATTSLRWMMGILVAVFAALIVLMGQALREPQLPADSAAALRQTVEASSGDTMPAGVDPSAKPESPSPAP